MLETTEVSDHSHPWPQIVFSDAGVIQVTTNAAAFAVPPQYAVWIPGNIIHSAVLLEAARLFSVYVFVPSCNDETPVRMPKEDCCRVLAVTPLLLELVRRLASIEAEIHKDALYHAFCEVIVR